MIIEANPVFDLLPTVLPLIPLIGAIYYFKFKNPVTIQAYQLSNIADFVSEAIAETPEQELEPGMHNITPEGYPDDYKLDVYDAGGGDNRATLIMNPRASSENTDSRYLYQNQAEGIDVTIPLKGEVRIPVYHPIIMTQFIGGPDDPKNRNSPHNIYGCVIYRPKGKPLFKVEPDE